MLSKIVWFVSFPPSPEGLGFQETNDEKTVHSRFVLTTDQDVVRTVVALDIYESARDIVDIVKDSLLDFVYREVFPEEVDASVAPTLR